MLRTFVNGKIHRLKVTGLQPMNNGSCLICPYLLAAAGIEPFEQVEIYSLTSTARIATYVFPGAAEGELTLNGGAALHFQLGDEVAVVAYRQEEFFSGASCVVVDPADNSILEFVKYEGSDRPLQWPSKTTRRRHFHSAALCNESPMRAVRPHASDAGETRVDEDDPDRRGTFGYRLPITSHLCRAPSVLGMS
jgi:aspartate 1-decarboxylase